MCVLTLKPTFHQSLKSPEEGLSMPGVHVGRGRGKISGLNLHCSFSIILDGRKFLRNWHTPSYKWEKNALQKQAFLGYQL